MMGSGSAKLWNSLDAEGGKYDDGGRKREREREREKETRRERGSSCSNVNGKTKADGGIGPPSSSVLMWGKLTVLLPKVGTLLAVRAKRSGLYRSCLTTLHVLMVNISIVPESWRQAKAFPFD
jgi:hypothetical protein